MSLYSVNFLKVELISNIIVECNKYMLHGCIHIGGAQTTFPGAQNIDVHNHVARQTCLRCTKKNEHQNV